MFHSLLWSSLQGSAWPIRAECNVQQVQPPQDSCKRYKLLLLHTLPDSCMLLFSATHRLMRIAMRNICTCQAAVLGTYTMPFHVYHSRLLIYMCASPLATQNIFTCSQSPQERGLWTAGKLRKCMHLLPTTWQMPRNSEGLEPVVLKLTCYFAIHLLHRTVSLSRL